MKYIQEEIARVLYGELKTRFQGDQNTLSKLAGLFKMSNAGSGMKVSIEGRGVHWKCIVERGNTQCQIHCFNYDYKKPERKGPEYYTYFKQEDVVVATGRTQEKQQTINAVAHWINNEPFEFLYKHFEFVDREKRALLNIKADIISFYPEVLNAEKIEVIDDHFYSYHLQVEHKERSCSIYVNGYTGESVYKFRWDGTFIFETLIPDTARMGLLVKQWVIDAEKPSVLKTIFTDIDFGKLAEDFEKGSPLEGEFLKSWDRVEEFFKEVNLPIQPDIMQLIKTMREKGFDKTLRAGTSLYDLLVSRSRRHGLKSEQPYVRFSFYYIKSIMEVQAWKEKALSYDAVTYTNDIETILKTLEQQSVS
jgi:hypothetical protein